jgi:hypothetical protein
MKSRRTADAPCGWGILAKQNSIRWRDPGNQGTTMSRPPLPPFTSETAAQKARMTAEAGNTRDPQRVPQALTPDSAWWYDLWRIR